MSERGDYRTRQREAVLGIFLSRPGQAMTAGEVRQALYGQGLRIGRTTVYRCIRLLYERGRLVCIKGGLSAQPASYLHRPRDEHRISVRCSGCGMIAPLSCDAVLEFEEHLHLDHGFTLNEQDCLLPGLCSACQAAETPRALRSMKGNP